MLENNFEMINCRKRIFSDQRLAELEALMAIEKQKQRVAHGVFDPMEM